AYSSGTSMTSEQADRLLAPYDPLSIVKSSRPDLDPGYLARRLGTLSAFHPGLRDRLDAFASSMDASSRSAYEVNAERLLVEGDPDAAQELVQQGLARYPDSEQLRFLYIRPWLARLARGTATREVALQAAKLTRSADAVVRGTALASQKHWDELSALDAPLAEAAWSDSWKLDAIALQVQWRCEQTDTPQMRRHWGEQALALTDQAIAAQPAIMLYALRVQSALAAGAPETVVESVWAYGHGLFINAIQGDDPPSGGTDRAAVRATLTQLL